MTSSCRSRNSTSFRAEGLIQVIALRDTKKIIEETYMIPLYFDINVAYKVNGVEKGMRVLLFYETGD